MLYSYQIESWSHEMKIIFLNIDQLSELRMPGASLFHSEITEGNLGILKMGILSTFFEV